jgi:PEP-CTERM motif
MGDVREFVQRIYWTYVLTIFACSRCRNGHLLCHPGDPMNRLTVIFCGFMLAALPSATALADPMIWSTSAGVAAWTFNLGNATVYVQDGQAGGNSSEVTGNTIQDGGYTLTYSGEAAAQRGVLHSYAYYGVTTPSSCYGCTFPIGSYGVNAVSHWDEYGVMAEGPQGSLGGIASYAFTFNLDGYFFNYGTGIYANLDDAITQGSSTTYAGAGFDGAAPLGPVTFYLQPPDPLQPFSFDFVLQAVAIGDSALDPLTGTVNFSNTASIASVVALDANGKVIPGVSLELGDGTMLGVNGFTSSTPPDVPEPSSIVLVSSGVLGLAGMVRRRALVTGFEVAATTSDTLRR